MIGKFMDRLVTTPMSARTEKVVNVFLGIGFWIFELLILHIPIYIGDKVGKFIDKHYDPRNCP